MTAQMSLHLDRELVVDYFAGGGGASTGIAAALGRGPDLAVNHDEEALAMHAANHPDTVHLRDDVFRVQLEREAHGWPVGLLWASPDCRHFSRAKGSKPISRKIRGLAWAVVLAAKQARPRVIIVENVREFVDWGPLDRFDRPIVKRKGRTFRAWIRALEGAGYRVEARMLAACDFGAPTTRERLFVLARRDGLPIRWPEPTHGPGRAHPHRTAAEIIDWGVPTRSIFGRKTPLVPKTLERIAKGLERFVFGDAEPFILRTGHHSPASGEGGYFRGQSVRAPLRTVTSTNDFALVVPHVTRFFGGMVGSSIGEPLPTVTAVDHHGLVAAFLSKYYGRGAPGSSLATPLPTQTSCERFALVEASLTRHGLGGRTLEIYGERYQIADVGLRMLTPRELARAQGFPEGYALTPATKRGQVHKIGNSVSPPVAEALVRVNYHPADIRRRSGRDVPVRDNGAGLEVRP